MRVWWLLLLLVACRHGHPPSPLPAPAMGVDATVVATPAPASQAARPPASAPVPPAGPPTARVYPSATAALAAILATRPRVLGFGEYHQSTKGPAVDSAVKRFTAELLPALSPRLSDLVVETWMTEGTCGKVEERVVANVQRTTERPKATENQVVALLTSAKAHGVQPHILKVSCAEYQQLMGGADVDYVKLLSLITRQLQGQATRILGARRDEPPRDIVALYGGAIHNDVFPGPYLEDYTYAPALQRVTGRYVEVDLFVPEYIDRDRSFKKEAWYPFFRRHARKGQALLIDRNPGRAPGSFIVVFPRSHR